LRLRGLLAATALSAFTVVGLVAGRVLTKDEWADLKRSAGNDDAALAGSFGAARSAQERELSLECFATELPPPGAPKGGRKKSRNASGGKKAATSAADGPPAQPLCLSSFGYGAPRAARACSASCPACGCPPPAVSACALRMSAACFRARALARSRAARMHASDARARARPLLLHDVCFSAQAT
jgi:hypothetical protein